MACVVRRLLCWLLALTIAFAVLVYVSSLLLHVPRPFREPVQNVLDGGAKREGAPVDPTKFRNQNRRERTELRDLSILMQKRINYLQNPANCTSAKKLACSFHRNRCGFGCLMHQVAFCFVLAYATERTLVIDSGGWRYSSEGWEGAFLPVSKCTIASNSAKGLIQLNESNVQINEALVAPNLVLNPFPQFPPTTLAVPRDLLDHLKDTRKFPFGWFAGQFLKYAMRPNPRLEQYIQERRKELVLHSPRLGCHIRRTDKRLDVPLERYMAQVENWFDREGHNINGTVGRNVFIATDDPTVFNETRKDYPSWNFTGDLTSASLATNFDDTGSRYTLQSLFGMVFDIFSLSECDYVVCTFSSNICRLVYELMSSLDEEAIYKLQSLDEPYSFYNKVLLYSVANMSHTAVSSQELSFVIGDQIGITGQRQDGWSMGVMKNRSEIWGLFPSHKVKQQLEVVDYPTYDNIKL